MEIFLDGQTYVGAMAEPPSVGEALIDVDRYLQSQGRALQSVELDGTSIPAEKLTMDVANTPRGAVSRLSVTSAKLSELVLEAIAEVEAVLPELPIACQALATVFASDEPGEGLGPLADLLEIWDALRESRRRVIGALNVSLATIPVENGTAELHEAALDVTLGRVCEAVEKQDFKGAADLIAYDLNEFAEREGAVFQALRVRCAA